MILTSLFRGLLVYFLFVSCTWTEPDFSQKVVVQVNSSQLLATDFAKRLVEELRAFDTLAVNNQKIVNTVKDRIVQNFIISAINKEWAKDHHIFVSNDELKNHIKNIQSHYPDDISFRTSLAKEKLDITSWDEKIKDSLLQKKIQLEIAKNIPSPTQEELRDFYKDNLHQFSQKPQVKVQQIVVNTRHHAKAILKTLKKQRGNPEDIAREFSITPEGKSGGHLGWIEKDTSPIFQLAFGLRLKEWSPVVKSPFGYHIFRILGKKKKQTLTFSEARMEIQRILLGKKQQDNFLKWLQKQVRSAQIYQDTELIANIVPQPKGK